MKKAVLALALLWSTFLQAAWYWPFESSEDNTNKPPRLHRLLEKANDFIELAEDESMNGDADKALTTTIRHWTSCEGCRPRIQTARKSRNSRR